MNRRTRRDVLALSATGIAGLAGCLGAGEEDDAAAESEDTVEAADWRTTTLDDVVGGESFTIEQFDVPVVLHSFALWCGSCRTQQREFAAFREVDDDAVIVDVNVDENEDADAVREHAAENGYDWRFVIASPEVTRGLVDEFGEYMAVAPRSPVVVLCPGGETESHEDIVTQADAIEDSVDSC